MIKDFEKLKRNYAKLILNRGVNLPKGRIIRIVADIDQPDFINILVKECYRAGAKRVHVQWSCANVDRVVLEKTSLKELKKIYPHKRAQIKFAIKNNVSHIYLESNDPNYLNGINPKKATSPKKQIHAYIERLRGDSAYQAPYTIACVPSKSWAKFLFPNLTEHAAVEKFWKLIFKICRVTADDPYRGWDEHCQEIDNRAKWLNSLNIVSLHYRNKLGTDLEIGMTDAYQFAGTADLDIVTKRKYYSNIPTEECFVSPHRLKTNGVVYASKPLCESGQLIEGICLKFKDGRIVESHATKNEKLLKQLIRTDEGTHYLGEAAIVPFTSPINQTDIIFYNTLYDENASCHFAFGDAYRYTYKGYEKMSKAELYHRGLNTSANHVDFMIGTDDLEIVATTRDQKKIVIFKNGNWAEKL